MTQTGTVIARMEACWHDLRREMDGLDLDTTVYPDPLWTARDVLLHCAFWNDESLKAIEAFAEGNAYLTNTGAVSFAEGLDAMNQRVVEGERSVPDTEVCARWIAAQERVAAAVRGLEDEAMTQEITCPWGGRQPVDRMVADAFAHEQDHIADIISAISASEGER